MSRPALAAVMTLAAAACASGASRASAQVPSASRCAVLRDFGDGRGPRRVVVTVSAVAGAAAPPGYYLNALVGEVGTRFRPPAADSVTHSGSLLAVINSDGSLAELTVDSAGPSAAFDDSLAAAVRAAANLRALEFQWADRPRVRDRVRLRLRLDPESARPAGTPSHLPVRHLPGNPSAPFPPEARKAGIGDQVLVHMIVDEAGRPQAEGFKIVDARYKNFIDAIVAVLPHWRFQPAEVDGCAVRQLVEMPWNFGFR